MQMLHTRKQKSGKQKSKLILTSVNQMGSRRQFEEGHTLEIKLDTVKKKRTRRGHVGPRAQLNLCWEINSRTRAGIQLEKQTTGTRRNKHAEDQQKKFQNFQREGRAKRSQNWAGPNFYFSKLENAQASDAWEKENKRERSLQARTVEFN